MANYKVAYGHKDNIDLAITLGVIPPGSIILTEDSNEIFFYDLNNRIKTYEQRYKFESYEEAESWVQRYNCQGQILSVHEVDKCNLYIVEYDNQLRKLGADYKASDKNPTIDDIGYDLLTHWINVVTEDVYILVSLKDNKASWKKLVTDITDSKDLSYKFTQSTKASKWVIDHSLGKYPSVSVIDDLGNAVIGDVAYIDENSIYLEFTSPVAGYAYLN